MGSGFWDTTVRLPQTRIPEFPDHCVRCMKDHPGRRITLSASRIPAWLDPFPFVHFFFSSDRYSVPACDACAWRVRLHQPVMDLLSLAFVLLVIVATFLLLDDVSRTVRNVSMVGAFLVGFTVIGFVQSRRPPALEITAEGKDRLFAFRETEYAALFRLRNVENATDCA